MTDQEATMTDQDKKEATMTDQDKKDFLDVMTSQNMLIASFVTACLANGADTRAIAAALTTLGNVARGWSIGRFG